MKKVKIYVTAEITKVTYDCPHCGKHIDYATNSLPTKSECASCLKPFESEFIYQQSVKK